MMETKLGELVSRLKEAAGKNLESVVLYGSAASGTYRPGTSDLNVLCTLVTIDVHELQLLAPVVLWWTNEEKEPTPLFFLSGRIAEVHRRFSHRESRRQARAPRAIREGSRG